LRDPSNSAAAEEAESDDQDYEEDVGAEIDEPTTMAPITTFKELGERGLVHKSIIRTLTQTMGLETMTQVQSLTISEAITGKDVYVYVTIFAMRAKLTETDLRKQKQAQERRLAFFFQFFRTSSQMILLWLRTSEEEESTSVFQTSERSSFHRQEN